MVSKSDHEIGGDCLNDGCVPSKALIHAAKIIKQASVATNFGLEIKGAVDIKKVTDYIHSKQNFIRRHENSHWLREQGIAVALGDASFVGKHEIKVGAKIYAGRNIVIATGSKPRKLTVEGVEQVPYFDNENIFNLDKLPKKNIVCGWWTYWC